VILFGATTDYCLFLTARYREELAHSKDYGQAIRRTLTNVGPAISASGLTTIVGLASMSFARFGVFAAVGPCLGLGLAVALATSLSFAPALLRLLGPLAFWPTQLHRIRGPSPVWRRVANLVVGLPTVTLVVVVALLAPLAYVGGQMVPSFDIISELPADKPSVEGYRACLRHFRAEDVMRVTLIMRSDRDMRTPVGLDALFALTENIKKQPYVAGVLSVSQPRGSTKDLAPLLASKRLGLLSAGLDKALGGLDEFAAGLPQKTSATALKVGLLRSGLGLMRSATDDMLALATNGENGWGDHLVTSPSLLNGTGETSRELRKVLDYYLSSDGHISRIVIALKMQPYSREAMDAVEDLRGRVGAMAGVVPLGLREFHFTGATARINDIRRLTTSDIRRIKILVIVGVLAVLVLQFRWLLTAVYLVATMVLSYYATLGVTVLVFTKLLGEPGLDWKVQYLMFVLLIALGVDYNILIMSRIKEERATAPPALAIRRAVMVTGRIITSCGIIMAGTFGSLMVSRLDVMVQLGFAIAFGVLLDTFVMRPIVVPAIAALTERFTVTVRYSPPELQPPRDA